uniref:PCI domain-containing protein 2 n=1 Tax=Phallusia mammillata TaxID=59560 RepID=A0A6F9DMM6_9ASCI|nr:PCI domain-containing protein 2 [Phallusia mammillata]
MSFPTLNAYLLEVSSSLDNADAFILAKLLSFKDSHVSNPKLHKESPELLCQRILDTPYDELVAAHLKGCVAVANCNYREAYACQVLSVQIFVRIFQPQKDDNWSLPLMYTLILDLRNFANEVEQEILQHNKGKKGDTLEKAADTIMSCFRVCASDGRAAIDVSKKWGMLFLVNQLFKIYFRIGKLHLCKPLIRAIESSNIKDEFSLAQKITYKYYVGRKAMFDSNFTQAEEFLTYAYTNCHADARSNLKRILIYLIPVKMLLGRLPPIDLLHSHNLSQYRDIVMAVRTGNVHLLNCTLLEHESFFIQTGVYLILEKLRATTFRTLFKRVSNILGTHQIPLQAFTEALHGQGITDIDMDETECIVAGLIYAGNIRGYISHQHKKLVVSKVNAFPAVAS